jgi:beta-lactamase superfamily II metal-dependent hydrolase
MSTLTRYLLLPVLLLSATLSFAEPGKLTIYWVDTEGGAATLIVAPSGQSMLVDTGYPDPQDRDANRIFEVAKLAGLRKIDVLLTTHFHADHLGGTPALAKLIPIDRFYDHGNLAEQGNAVLTAQYLAYTAVAEGKRTLLAPGAQIPLAGVQIAVVAADGKTITEPLKNSKTNPFCEEAEQKPADTTENQRSIGFVLTYGKFKFLSLGDLTWDKEMELACPVNKLGTVSLFQATHHGFFKDRSGAPALVWAVAPRAVVVNNGASKGLGANAYETLTRILGVQGIWQLHRATDNDAVHNTSPDMIANIDPASDGHWIKATVSKDGRFTISNGRNGFSKTY